MDSSQVQALRKTAKTLFWGSCRSQHDGQT